MTEPNIQFRGPCPERVNYHDDFELVAFRHRQLRRCPNPKPADLASNDEWVRRAAGYAWKKFYPVWIGSAYTREDLEQIGRIHLVTYLHMYRLHDPQQNIALLLTYLGQRFGELAKLVNLKLACTRLGISDEIQEDRVANSDQPDLTLPVGTWRVEMPAGPRRLVVGEPTYCDWAVTLDGVRVEAQDLDRICMAVADGSLVLYPDHDPVEPLPDPKVRLRAGLAGLAKEIRRSRLEGLVEDSDPEIGALAKAWLERIGTTNEVRVIPRDTQDVAELVRQARQKCFDETPAEVVCCRCNQPRPKDQFVIRVERDPKTRLPTYTSVHRYCKGCKREWTRENAAKQKERK